MKPIPDHVREAFPCIDPAGMCSIRQLSREGWHAADCPADYRDIAECLLTDYAAAIREARDMLGDGFNGDGDEYPRCCDTCNGSPKDDWRYKEYAQRHAERPDLVDLSSWGHKPNCARAALIQKLDGLVGNDVP